MATAITVKVMVYIGGSKYPGRCYNCSRYCGCDTLRLFRDDRRPKVKWVPICVDCCEDWDKRHNSQVVAEKPLIPVVTATVVEEAKPAPKPTQLSLF
jgi:hypothetical protein